MFELCYPELLKMRDVTKITAPTVINVQGSTFLPWLLLSSNSNVFMGLCPWSRLCVKRAGFGSGETGTLFYFCQGTFLVH